MNRATTSPNVRLSGFQSDSSQVGGISIPCTREPSKEANANRPNTQHHKPTRHRFPLGIIQRRANTKTHSMASTASVTLVVSSVGEAAKFMGVCRQEVPRRLTVFRFWREQLRA